MHEVLDNRLGGITLSRKSVVRLTDRPDMTLDVYRGRKTTTQHNNYNFGLSECNKVKTLNLERLNYYCEFFLDWNSLLLRCNAFTIQYAAGMTNSVTLIRLFKVQSDLTPRYKKIHAQLI